jgi:hypothetical protein
MFNDSGFSPYSPDVQQAAQTELARRKGVDAAQGTDVGAIAGNAGGIIGAILSGVTTGNPLVGYAAGKAVGGALGGKKRGDGSQMPGLEQLQAVLRPQVAGQEVAQDEAQGVPGLAGVAKSASAKSASPAASLLDLSGFGG